MWYNGSTKIVAPAVLVAPRSRIRLTRRHIMDILRSDSPESNLLKRCTGPCQRELPVTAEFFYRTKSGFVARCKMCINAQSSIYYAEHQERIREKQGRSEERRCRERV